MQEQKQCDLLIQRKITDDWIHNDNIDYKKCLHAVITVPQQTPEAYLVLCSQTWVSATQSWTLLTWHHAQWPDFRKILWRTYEELM